MKLMYGDTPIKNLNIIKHDVSTNDATMSASDLQAGVTAYARGQKITGTGKCFEFAFYGDITTNVGKYIPSNINVIEISSSEYPVKLAIDLGIMQDVDFSSEQKIATIIIDNTEYDLVASVQSSILKISCDQTARLQVFYGKDNYV